MSVAEIAAVTALVAGGITVGLIVILHVLKPEYDPSWRMISEYSLGRHGWVMRLAFLTMAVALGATCLALWPFGGAWTIALATSSRRFMPPDSVRAYASRLSDRRTASSSSSYRRSALATP